MLEKKDLPLFFYLLTSSQDNADCSFNTWNIWLVLLCNTRKRQLANVEMGYLVQESVISSTLVLH